MSKTQAQQVLSGTTPETLPTPTISPSPPSSGCTHHWVLESPAKGLEVYSSTCKKCNGTASFRVRPLERPEDLTEGGKKRFSLFTKRA